MSRFMYRQAYLAFAFVLFTACGKGDAPPADSAASAAAAAPRSLVGAAPAAPAAMPGALTKPIEQYTADEFAAFVKKLQYVGAHERQRNCKGNPGCDGPRANVHTRVLVDAVATQDSLSATTTPQFGVVYIHAINKGNQQEKRYGFLPGPQIEYYVIVTAQGGAMTWTLEQLDTKANTLTQTGTGRFTGCNHAWVAGAQADFKTCANAASGRDSLVKLGRLLQGGDDDPLWTACSTGCCTADT
ncbi:MAG: hypothetical protein V4550_21285 [Gemmatimonadota bacterium]